MFNAEKTSYPVSFKQFWDITTTYAIGDIVEYNNIIFVSATNGNIGNNPINDTTNWTQGVLVSSYSTTLTDTFTLNTSRPFFAQKLNNVTIDYIYTPKAGETNRYALLLVEMSNDMGTTYYPRPVGQDISTETKAYSEGTGSTTGIPIIIPGDKTSTGGTAIKGSFNITEVGDFFRVSVKEDSAGNHGTFKARITFSSQL